MSNKILVLDEGHGFNTAGKRTLNGCNGIVREWTMNNKVVSYIIEYLKGYNVDIKVVNDRTGATDTTLADRCNRANSYKADLFVSIHHNAFQSVWGNHTGTSVYIHDTKASAFSKQVAEVLAPKLAQYTGLRNRGVCKDDFYVLRNTNCPAVLVEGGFMDSNIDYPVITSTNGQMAYAKAVAEAVIQCLGLVKVGTKPTETPSNPSVSSSNAYTVKINTDVLNVRAGAGTNYKINTTVKRNEVYTIVEEKNGWGRLKSGAGWICLDYCIKQGTVTNQAPIIKEGSKVKIVGNTYATGQTIPNWVKSNTYTVKTINNDKALIQEITSWVYIKDLVLV